jgi:hypothetical protein
LALPGLWGRNSRRSGRRPASRRGELATIAGLSVHAVSALERGKRRRPHVETVRALTAALDLTGAIRDALVGSARAGADTMAVDELSGVSLPRALTAFLGRDAEVQTTSLKLSLPGPKNSSEP